MAYPIRMRGRRTALVVAVLGVVALAGCSAAEPEGESPGEAEAAATGTPETAELVVSQYALPQLAPTYVGIEEEIFDGYGLEVTPSLINTIADGAAALQAGESQMYYTNLLGVVNASLAGIELRIVTEVVAASPGVQGLVVLPDSDIESVADLPGTKVGIAAVNSSLDATLNASVKSEGGDPSKIEYVQLPYVDIPAALEQGTIDAGIVTGAPYDLAKSELGAVTIWDVGGGEYDGFAQGSFVTSKEFADANPTTIANFQCAWAEAVDVTKNNRPTYLAAVAPALSITEEELDAQGTFSWLSGARPDKLTQISDVMVAADLIAEPFDLNALVIPMPETC